MKVKDKKCESGKIHLVQPVEKICFGFSHMTKNKTYSFAKVAVGDKIKAYEAFLERLEFLCGLNISEARQIGKKFGVERIPYEQLSEQFQGVCDASNIVSKDSKVVVFQFYNHRYRLICKDDIVHSNLMHIIGFDFDYSAYDHG